MPPWQMFIQAECPQILRHSQTGPDILRSYLTEDAVIRSTLADKAFRRRKDPDRQKEILNIRNLWFSYHNGQEVLKNISFSMKAGEFVVLMGSNGTGKTTLLKQINSLLKPDRGQITVLGQDSRSLSVEDLACDIGYLSQNPSDYLFLATVRRIEFYPA